ncbi:MAG TPA: hypothetical protein VHE57_05385 [Mycobacteriales bacterium]|nr:hypothetical protein [Mycobacteriales bacterium]
MSARLRAGAFAGVVASAVTMAAVIPGGGAAAATARAQSVRHGSVLAAVNRLPDYFPGVVKWKVSTSLGHYGTTNWNTNTITISAFTPINLLYSVTAHEWSHEIQAYDYHRDFWGIVKSMNRHFGGGGASGQRGVEYSADCMAIELGATWTDYTSCHNHKWRHYARRLLKGHALKARHRHHKPAAKPGSGTTTSQEPTGTPTPTSTDYPEPDQYPAPQQYQISWT